MLATVNEYRSAMASFATMGNLEVWYSHLDVEGLIRDFASQYKPRVVKRTKKTAAKAQTRDSMSAFSKLTNVVDGEVRIVDQSPLIVPIDQLGLDDRERDETFDLLHELLRSYRETLEFDRRVLLEQYELVDFARKVVGVASVGTGAWIALLLGRAARTPCFCRSRRPRLRC